jgi:hypothetical protein
MSFEKPAKSEGKKILLQIAAPVLAFFAGQQVEKTWGGPNHETEEVSPNIDVDADTQGLIGGILDKSKEIAASEKRNAFFHTPAGEVQISHGPDGTFAISKRDKQEGWTDVETTVYRITDDSLYFAKGKNLAEGAFGHSGDSSMEYAVHYKWNQGSRDWQIAHAQTDGVEGAMATSAESEIGEDLLLLDWITKNALDDKD